MWVLLEDVLGHKDKDMETSALTSALSRFPLCEFPARVPLSTALITQSAFDVTLITTPRVHGLTGTMRENQKHPHLLRALSPSKQELDIRD